MFPDATHPARRSLLLAGAAALLPAPRAHAAVPGDDPFEGDPLGSLAWPAMRREFLGPRARAVFDPRVVVRGPAFAEDPLNVPIAVSVDGLADVERIVVLVDRNPIRQVLDFEPRADATRPAIAFRFKLEQASPVRAAARTGGGLWHVGSTVVESSGGGCTVPGSTRKDGSWARTLGQVSGRLFDALDGFDAAAARLRLRVMHPMDTGLAAGIPAFYLRELSVLESGGAELLRLATWEPVSENPVFSFDFARRPSGPFRVTGVDNNGNRIEGRL
jgi:sulfur-oxidizing protein SoxY